MMTLVDDYQEELAVVKAGGSFETKATEYLKDLVSNIRSRFPQICLFWGISTLLMLALHKYLSLLHCLV